jgi:hypothetical protein
MAGVVSSPRDELVLMFHCDDMPGFMQWAAMRFDVLEMRIPPAKGQKINLNGETVRITSVQHDAPLEGDPWSVTVFGDLLGDLWTPGRITSWLQRIPGFFDVEVPHVPKQHGVAMCDLCERALDMELRRP